MGQGCCTGVLRITGLCKCTLQVQSVYLGCRGYPEPEFFLNLVDGFFYVNLAILPSNRVVSTRYLRHPLIPSVLSLMFSLTYGIRHRGTVSLYLVHISLSKAYESEALEGVRDNHI